MTGTGSTLVISPASGNFGSVAVGKISPAILFTVTNDTASTMGYLGYTNLGEFYLQPGICNLVNGEPIAFLGGESVEEKELFRRLDLLIDNFIRSAWWTDALMPWLEASGAFGKLLPGLLIAPLVLKGKLSISAFSQTQVAWSQLGSAFGFFGTEALTFAFGGAVIARVQALRQHCLQRPEPADAINGIQRIASDHITARNFTAEWRWQVGVAAVPAVGFLVLLYSIPRSPRWSVSRQHIEEALEVLRRMGDPDPHAEVREIRMALAQEHASAHERVLQWKYRFPLFLAISIGAFNQLTGINAILYYLPNIFSAAGFSQISGDQQAIVIGLTNLVFTMAGLSLIDKIGRKTLLLVGAAGTAGCLGGVAWIFQTNAHAGALLGLLMAYSAFFAVSQGAVIWVYIGEVFPNAVRSKGQGAGNASHWIMNTAIALEFPVVVHRMSSATPFVFFAAMTAAQFLVVLLVYPETKGQSLEQLQRRLVAAS
jgi:hypothetical protein